MVAKNSNELSLKDAINNLLKAYKLDEGLNETKLLNSWEHVAGKMITKHTTKTYIRNKTLYIQLDSPALKHELSFAKTKLIKTLNDKVNQQVIDEIIFI